jgi:hypothetical protein
MPNWCSNTLTIEGSPNDIVRFKEKAKGISAHSGEETVLSFQSICPMPDCKLTQYEQSKDFDLRLMGGEIERTKEQLLEDAWYYWHLKHWDTKWDIHPEQWDVAEPSRLELNFDTAWSPPLGAIAWAGEMFPELKFRLQYYELGCDFAGVYAHFGVDVTHNQGGPREFDFSRGVLEEFEAEEEEFEAEEEEFEAEE